MSQSLAISTSSDKLHQAADLLDQVSQLLREVGQPLIIPSDQAYFWTEEWQEWMKTSEQEIQTGQVKSFPTMEALVADLGL